MNNTLDTIAAISTPLSAGAISIVRLSGPEAIKIADKVFKAKDNSLPSTFPARTMTLGTFSAEAFTELCLCVVFKAPASYTGEDVVEFHCHGGVTITRGVLARLLAEGARLAEPGEFTKRAFISGKMALSDAEGMMDMINAQSEAEVRAGYNLLSGKLSQMATKTQEKLTDIMAELEVSLDYPEEDIEYVTKDKAKTSLEKINNELKDCLATARVGKIIRDGVNVVILGEPNVGKSSLLNALLKDERAIVTPIAGTTRDVIEGSMQINGLRFNLYDTAGLRETSDVVEKIGVDKAKKILRSADIVLTLFEDGQPEALEPEVEELLKGKKVIKIISKADKSGNYSANDQVIHLSVTKNKNIDKLIDTLYRLSDGNKEAAGGVVLTNERHINAIKRATEAIEKVLDGMEISTLDCLLIDLHLAYSALGEITGNTSGEDIINTIFSKFCLGK